MKHLLLPLFMFIAITTQAQVELGMHYMYSQPLGELGQNIQPVQSFEMFGYGRLKFERQFYVGAEIAFGSYAHKTQMQTYISPEDGSETMTDVDFSSNIHRYHLVAGYDMTKETMVIPYVTVRGGASIFKTNIVIQDPDDHHDCHPLDEENLFKDVAFSGGAGVGFKIDATAFFKNWNKGRTWLDISASYQCGTTVDYINVKYLNPDDPGLNPVVRDVNAEFIDLHTQHVHEHSIAQVYTSPLNLLDFRIGIVKRFGGRGD